MAEPHAQPANESSQRAAQLRAEFSSLLITGQYTAAGTVLAQLQVLDATAAAELREQLYRAIAASTLAQAPAEAAAAAPQPLDSWQNTPMPTPAALLPDTPATKTSTGTPWLEVARTLAGEAVQRWGVFVVLALVGAGAVALLVPRVAQVPAPGLPTATAPGADATVLQLQLPERVVAGQQVPLVVSALTRDGSIAGGYAGTLQADSPAWSQPVQVQMQPVHSGQRVIGMVSFARAGSWSVSVQDISRELLRGELTIEVQAAATGPSDADRKAALRTMQATLRRIYAANGSYPAAADAADALAVQRGTGTYYYLPLQGSAGTPQGYVLATPLADADAMAADGGPSRLYYEIYDTLNAPLPETTPSYRTQAVLLGDAEPSGPRVRPR